MVRRRSADNGVMVRCFATLTAAVLLAGCGSERVVPVDDAAVQPTVVAEPAPPESLPTPNATSEDAARRHEEGEEAFTDPVIVFIALLSEALADTQWQSDVFDAPDVFVATGELFCERLAEGVAADEVLTAYTAAVSAEAEARDDVFVLAGSILGTAVGTLCTEHRAMVEALS
jgi:hypothetical protein